MWLPELKARERKRSPIQLRKLPLVLFALAAASGIAQSPNEGKITATSYENSYFKFSYTWPSILRPYPMDSLALPHGSYANEYALFSARQGNEPYGVVVIAERLHVVTLHSSGLRDGADFLDRVAKFRPEQHAVILSRKHLKNASGIDVDVLDYTENGAPSSAITAQIGQFLIVFKCVARAASELEEMDRSAIALKYNPAR